MSLEISISAASIPADLLTEATRIIDAMAGAFPTSAARLDADEPDRVRLTFFNGAGRAVLVARRLAAEPAPRWRLSEPSRPRAPRASGHGEAYGRANARSMDNRARVGG